MKRLGGLTGFGRLPNAGIGRMISAMRSSAFAVLRTLPLFILAACVATSMALAQATGDASTQPAPAADLSEHPPIPYRPVDPAKIQHIDFDVATFKLNKTGGAMPYLQIPLDGDGFAAQNRPIHDLIRYAFAEGRGGTYQISGQPNWVDDDRYDIQAKVAPEDLARWKSMNALGKKLAMRGFLVEYLKLTYHPDTTPRPYYALVVGKNGVKMKEAHASEEYKGPHGEPISHRTLMWVDPSDLNGYGCEMERLADMMTGYTDRPVRDETGLRNYYNFTAHFDGADNPNNPNAPEVPFLGVPLNLRTPLVLSAVKQLGLEMKPAKGPLDGMVIEHIERPPAD
jgi:uncharacterized protein (TIGR03435 family)